MFYIYLIKDDISLKFEFLFNSLWATKIKLFDLVNQFNCDGGGIIDNRTAELIEEYNRITK